MTFSDDMIEFGGKKIKLEYPIFDAFAQDDKIIILFNPDSYKKKFGQFPNLIAISRTGEIIWTAELPTNSSGDRYYQLSSRIPLTVDSIFSFECEIDVGTGKILKKSFHR